jgi:hypothetical protein
MRQRPFLSPEADIPQLFALILRLHPLKPATPGWNRCCSMGGVPLEVVIGRSVACCVHPSASWRRLPASGRVLLVAAYVSASYVTVLTLLFLIV